jgi:hypothetical protein
VTCSLHCTCRYAQISLEIITATGEGDHADFEMLVPETAVLLNEWNAGKTPTVNPSSPTMRTFTWLSPHFFILRM